MELIGALCALGVALTWAGGSIILKFLTVKIDALSLSTLRLWFISLCLLAFIPLSGRSAEFMHTPLQSVVYVAISGVFAFAIGDAIYIKSLSFLDVSQAYPTAICSQPVFTMFLAVLLLKESFTWLTGVGAFLVLLGVYLITTGKKSEADSASGGISRKGVILAITAAVLWAIAASTLKMGVIGLDPFVAVAIRMPSGAIVLSLFTLTQKRRGTLQFQRYGSRSVALAATEGLLSLGIGGVLFVLGTQLIGVGRTVLLSSVSPLFLLPFSVLFLKEKLTGYALVGILICVAGIYLVAI